MLAFLDNFTDLAKWGEWIAAIFAGLAWATGHPSTACWAIGAVLIVAVLRKGWPFQNVPEISTFLGKAIATTGLVLIVGGFAWRAADEVFGGHAPQAKPPASQSAPAQRQTITMPTSQAPIVPPSG